MQQTRTKTTIALSALLAALIATPHTPAKAVSGFQPYKDAQKGFALAKPDGWNVHTEDLAIWVQSPDKSELVLTQAFRPAPGETAAQWLEKLADKYGDHFPQASLDHIAQQHTKGDEVVAALHYQGPNGPSELRTLCSIVNGKGLLYVIAAPASRFSAERPKLLHVAQSLVFTVPKGSASEGGNGGGGGVTPAQIAATARGIHWVKWTDPREHAFSFSAPQGWTVQGGTFRENGNANFAYVVLSPKKDMAIVVGTPQFLGFTAPNQMTQQMGMREGQNGVYHYMHAPEFNELYLHEAVSKQVDDLKPEQGQELESLSQQLTRQINQALGGGSTEHLVSAGVTQFKGIDKETQKPIDGILMSETTRTTMPGVNEPLVFWSAQTMLLLSQTGDSQDAARVRTTMAVYGHVMQSFTPDPEWAARRSQEVSSNVKKQSEQNIANIKAIGAMAHQNAVNSAATEDAIMGRYESHRAAQDNQQRNFINYIGDRTDVTDGAGHTANVGSGYKHYYRNDRTGTIMGTESAYSPGVDFSPMSEY